MSDQSVHSQSASRPNDSLFKVKLLAALRSGDPALIVPLISELNKGSRSSLDSSVNEAAAAALHLAIRCASCETVQLLLQQRAISPNSIDPPGSGISALHLAASIGRADVVTLLLDQEETDDTLRNAQGKTCKEVAKTREIARIIQDSRSLLTASFLSLLRTYILSPPTAPAPDALLRLLQSPRIRNVDLNQLDAASGTGILHEAVRRKDLRLIELAVRSGADVFIRDRRGRGLSEVAGKDDRIKAYLKQFINHDQTLLEAPSLTVTQEPTMRGYLNKYGNVAKGYNNRWFVLKDGMLSYYRHQDDENLACRGSLSMRNARVKASSTDKLRFEVHASTRNGEGIPEKWYMKANHAIEVTRWVQSLQRAIDWSQRGRSGDSDAGSIISTGTDVGTQSSHSPKKRFSRVTKNAVFGSMKRSNSSKKGSSSSSLHHEPLHTTVATEGYSSDEDTSTKTFSQDHPPYQESFELLGNTAATHIDLAVQLLAGLDSAEPSDLNIEETRASLKATIFQAQSMFTEYSHMTQEREAWFKAKLARERERVGIWEESLHKVVKEGEELEEELKRTIKQNKLQKRRSRALHDLDLDATVRQKPVTQASVSQSPDIIVPPTLSPVDERTPVPEMMVSAQAPARHNTKEFQPPPPPAQAFQDRVTTSRMSTQSDDSDSDEFFDAVEANALPNMVIPEPLKTHSVIPTSKTWIDASLFEGYAHPRKRLAISADNRPPVSLWAVLKGAIGKDLTRISFPVFFNEPTSMLQRMAEDMEFSECLDTAANEQDPIKRIAYVAAFAMSNYSSTIGRIAKPFNPMLVESSSSHILQTGSGETFEYVRLDREYRYISEQVSHHPPISACWADSPRWHYYGEVDAKNKFAGKSFEIKPTGVAHADLKLPKAWAPSYPPLGQSDKDHVLEHYSWKKVTTNVSGFIVGNPTIDHYGEMRVTNHRTRDQCVLTFKPRGWRDAFEIKGQVLNAKGEVQYDIAGRWNSQLVARKAGNHPTDLLPDVAVGDNHSMNQPYEYILLWRNTVKPVAPFRLTPYAITLNDCPETLEPYLPPTDCRLRPDQRAFELCMYERASELKSEQEDLQRATRKQRETGQLPPHRPRWFQPKVEADTGERYWAPIMQGEQLEYWFQREQVVKGMKSNAPVEWKDVDPIFVEADL